MGRRKRNSIKRLLLGTLPIVLMAIVGWLVASISLVDKEDGHLKVDGDLLAVVTPQTIEEQIVDYEGMRISFNKKTHNPNWVAWELTRDEAQGTHPRSNNFITDDRIKGCARPEDYKHSGFDRGHMAPAGDMKWSEKAMNESFYMTNICPQDNRLNKGAWNKLEEKCRNWAIADSAIIIICGPVPDDPVDMKIGESGVVVPKRFFKVVLSPYVTPARGIGFIMNNGPVKGGMQQAAVSIDEVERVTGYDFFSSLPDDIEEQVESQCRLPR